MTTFSVQIPIAGATLDAGLESVENDRRLQLANTISYLVFYTPLDTANAAAIYSAAATDVAMNVIESAPLDTDVKKYGAGSFSFSALRKAVNIAADGHDGGASGTIEFWLAPQYSGPAPSGTNAFVRATDGWGGNQNLINLFHTTGGTLTFRVCNSFPSTFDASVAFSATDGVFQHISMEWDFGQLKSWLYIDGVKVAEKVLVGSRESLSLKSGGMTFGAENSARNARCHIDDIAIYNSAIRGGVDFTPPAAAIAPYSVSSPSASLVELDSGDAGTTWDMSTIEDSEALIDLAANAPVASVEYQYRSNDISGSGSYNGTWLTLAQLQAESDPKGRYFQIKARFVSDGHQRTSLDDFSISVTLASDTTAPPVPVLTLTSTALKTLRLAFTGVTDTGGDVAASGVDHYEIHLRAGASISDEDIDAGMYTHDVQILHRGNGTAHTTDIASEIDGTTALSDETTYHVRIVAVDANGNGSVGSVEKTVTTPAVSVPTAGISGRISTVTNTGFTAFLTAFPSSNITHWRMAYRVKNQNTPADWTFSSSSSTLSVGALIAVTGLTSGTVYEVAFQAVNSGTAGDLGRFLTIVPQTTTPAWDGTQIAEQIATLIDDNLTASNRLGLTRSTQIGRLDDYPALRAQTANLPWCIIELMRGGYRWRSFPDRRTLEYEVRILHVWDYSSSEDVAGDRVQKSGMLAGLFVQFPDLGLDGGLTSKGQVLNSIPTDVETRPPEDQEIDHAGEVAVIAVTLRVETSVRP